MYEEGIVCRHRDGNPKNNAASNILLGTQSQNMLDRPAADRSRGAWIASRGVAKYDHEKVIAFYVENGFKATLLEFGIRSKGTLSFIINRTKTATPVAIEDRPKRRLQVTLGSAEGSC